MEQVRSESSTSGGKKEPEFIKSTFNSIFNCHDPKGIKFIRNLRLSRFCLTLTSTSSSTILKIH